MNEKEESSIKSLLVTMLQAQQEQIDQLRNAIIDNRARSKRSTLNIIFRRFYFSSLVSVLVSSQLHCEILSQNKHILIKLNLYKVIGTFLQVESKASLTGKSKGCTLLHQADC